MTYFTAPCVVAAPVHPSTFSTNDMLKWDEQTLLRLDIVPKDGRD